MKKQTNKSRKWSKAEIFNRLGSAREVRNKVNISGDWLEILIIFLSSQVLPGLMCVYFTISWFYFGFVKSAGLFAWQATTRSHARHNSRFDNIGWVTLHADCYLCYSTWWSSPSAHCHRWTSPLEAPSLDPAMHNGARYSPAFGRGYLNSPYYSHSPSAKIFVLLHNQSSCKG